MKVEELRLLIREEVREVMREELRDILTEAVQIASAPAQPAAPAQHLHFTTPSWVQQLPGANQTVSEAVKPSSKIGLKKDPMAILAETARGMSREDFSNFSNGV